ncbi:hypothetical protein [Flavobacterium sp. 9]|uniref:hypothetical protein n=1 Tax=Flavobacterium sp. 9 TaxID=2035198 RepID=UPI0011981FBC|nr:hypothetical protein [Flavobacterium sp. 9]
MKNILKNLIAKSGKKTVVSFENKDKRNSLDESFGKEKIEIASKFIGNDENSIALSKKLAEAQ